MRFPWSKDSSEPRLVAYKPFEYPEDKAAARPKRSFRFPWSKPPDDDYTKPQKYVPVDYSDPNAPQPSGISKKVVAWLVAGGVVLGMVIGIVAGVNYRRSRDVLVSVNGVTITKPRYYATMEGSTHGSVLTSMVNDELILQLAASKKVLPTDADIAKRFKGIASTPGYSTGPLSKLLSPADIHRAIQVDLARQAVLAPGAHVTDPMVVAYYKRNVDPANPTAKFYTPESVTAQVIITPTEKEAGDAKARLDAGIAFASVALQFSHDLSRRNGGMLPSVTRASCRIPGLADALFSLNPGDTSSPVQIRGIWWVIRCLERRPAVTRKLDDVFQQCWTDLAVQQVQSTKGADTDREIAEFNEKAKIVVFDPRYNDLFPQRVRPEGQ
ncbi:MAG TPA: peptidyl-prolyl cis-trans isomerase [Capsulimonadaceae bacterium]